MKAFPVKLKSLIQEQQPPGADGFKLRPQLIHIPDLTNDHIDQNSLLQHPNLFQISVQKQISFPLQMKKKQKPHTLKKIKTTSLYHTVNLHVKTNLKAAAIALKY